MLEEICNFAFSYTSEDFKNWLVGIGTLALGGGTIALSYAALKTIPEKLGMHYKEKEIISLYQKVIYRMYREVEASEQGITFSLPQDVEQLTNILLQRFPQIGSKEDADRLMDDMMLDDYFKYVQGNATVMKTSKWNPRDRTQQVKPKVEDLPSDDDDEK